jgi:uncharacterized membrane protein SpoIIM required for sporulation
MFVKRVNSWVEEAFDYVAENRKYVYTIALIFVVAGIFGFVFSDSFSFLDEVLRDILSKTEGLGTFELILFIFKNNSFSALIGLFFGFALGIVPIVNALTNGALIGYVLERTYELVGIGEFWRLLPHGIFELPAIFIALGMGVRLGRFITAKKGKKVGELKERLRKSALVYLFVVIPLLVIAAIIEGLLIGLGV